MQELGAWDQFNPTKAGLSALFLKILEAKSHSTQVFIDACCFLGLASNRRRCSRKLQDLRRLQMLGLKDMGYSYAAGRQPFYVPFIYLFFLARKHFDLHINLFVYLPIHGSKEVSGPPLFRYKQLVER